MREEGILPNASLYFTLLMSLKRVRSAASLSLSLFACNVLRPLRTRDLT
jgi:hypothetical protein